MAKLLLGITCMVLSVLLVEHPADAAWWDTKHTVVCVEMTDILATTPTVPDASAVQVLACNSYTNDRLVEAVAHVIWFSGPDGSYLYHQSYPLNPGDLVVNAGQTKATLRFAENLLVWSATGFVETDTSDQIVRDHGHVVYRQAHENVEHWAAVAGTFENQIIGPQNAGRHANGTRIFKGIVLETAR